MVPETIKLDYPINVDGVEVGELRLRRVSVLDLEVMGREKSDLLKSIRLLAQVADLPMDTIREMDAADFNKVSEVVSGFLD